MDIDKLRVSRWQKLCESKKRNIKKALESAGRMILIVIKYIKYPSTTLKSDHKLTWDIFQKMTRIRFPMTAKRIKFI